MVDPERACDLDRAGSDTKPLSSSCRPSHPKNTVLCVAHFHQAMLSNHANLTKTVSNGNTAKLRNRLVTSATVQSPKESKHSVKYFPVHIRSRPLVFHD